MHWKVCTLIGHSHCGTALYCKGVPRRHMVASTHVPWLREEVPTFCVLLVNDIIASTCSLNNPSLQILEAQICNGLLYSILII